MVELTVGSEIAGLRIGPVAGRGGSSTVYRAVDLQTGQPRAAKVLTTADDGAARRLEREAELLSRVDHPSVVPFRGLHRDGHRSILVTDWVEGRSLQEQLQLDGALSTDRVLRILADLADPLDHLHQRGIVHRDISPANVIVGPDGRVTLIDLGIGHLTDASTLTNDDLLAGTPKYLAPEVIRGQTADARSDQYSVAILVHELLTGDSPFPSGEQIATALHHQLSSTPTALDEIDPSIPTPLSDAVLRALAKEPKQRFPSMTEFASAAASPVSRADSAPIEGRPKRAVLVGGLLGVVAVLAAGALAVSQLISQEDGVDTAGVVDAAGAVDTAAEEVLAVTIPPEVSALAAPIDDPTWQAGRAQAVQCNLLSGHTFENGSVPVDYYGNPPGRERVIDRDGFDGSWALEVGLVGAYGQYGEIIDIEPGRDYLFRGWFEVREPVADAEFGVFFLDDAYQQLDDPGASRLLSNDETDSSQPGFREVILEGTPAGAARAVPFLYKDSSDGVLLADELVFGPVDECRAEFPELAE